MREPVGTLTVWRFLKIFYTYAARFERWRSREPMTDAERIQLQKERAARDAARL